MHNISEVSCTVEGLPFHGRYAPAKIKSQILHLNQYVQIKYSEKKTKEEFCFFKIRTSSLSVLC